MATPHCRFLSFEELEENVTIWKDLEIRLKGSVAQVSFKLLLIIVLYCGPPVYFVLFTI